MLFIVFDIDIEIDDSILGMFFWLLVFIFNKFFEVGLLFICMFFVVYSNLLEIFFEGFLLIEVCLVCSLELFL